MKTRRVVTPDVAQEALEKARAYYATLYPLAAPQTLRAIRRNPLLLVLALITAAASLLAATRTLPAFYEFASDAFPWWLKALEAGAAGIAFDVGFPSLSFMRARRADPGRHRLDLNAWLLISIIVFFGIQVTAQLFMTVRDIPAEWGTLISVVIGVSAPLAAAIPAHACGTILEQIRAEMQQSVQEYQAALQDREASFLSWFETTQSWFERSVLAGKPVPLLSATVRPVSAIPHDSALPEPRAETRKRRTDGVTARVRQHLTNHPEDRDLPVSELMERLQAGKTVVYDVLKELDEGNGYH